MMTEKQGDKIIELLDSIDSRLAQIDRNTNYVETHTSNTDSNTDDLKGLTKTMISKMDDLINSLSE